jgi:hypothetical protein
VHHRRARRVWRRRQSLRTKIKIFTKKNKLTLFLVRYFFTQQRRDVHGCI